ncbi:UNVERIFIED_CONTAM: 2-oxoglutarate dehydrogenase, mitochondrial [Sesamum radiatum]|uniref:2-oxoglutarate dehydrogenase, mitochondrial n=1 Tax=Sesamum radiatum TaxID=300843 RepID=A0AAW2U811_SESRA
MAWFRAGSNVAKLAVRRTLSQSCTYLKRTRVSPARNQYFHTTVCRSKAQSAPVPRPVPLSRLTDSFLDGTSSVYLEELQRAWEQDPNSVDESWDNFFRNFWVAWNFWPNNSREYAVDVARESLPGLWSYESQVGPIRFGREVYSR